MNLYAELQAIMPSSRHKAIYSAAVPWKLCVQLAAPVRFAIEDIEPPVFGELERVLEGVSWAGA